MSKQFRGCDADKIRTNIVFSYPSRAFDRDADEVADNLQAAFEVMAAQYPPVRDGVDYRQSFAGDDRIVIGYRRGGQHATDGQPVDQDATVCAGYLHSDRRINIPWDCLDHAENNHGFHVGHEFQPEYCCGHELGHPFESIRLDNNPNQEEWKEGLCDFGRLLLLRLWSVRQIRFRPIAAAYERYISTIDPSGSANTSNERQYHYAARLILEWCQKTSSDGCFVHLGDLFDKNMTDVIGSWRSNACP
jgi:hypothetical protein